MLDSVRHLSASSINDLLVCERRYAYARGIDPEVTKPAPNEYLTLGQAVHAMIRAYYSETSVDDAYDGVVQEALSLDGDTSLAEKHAQSLYQQFLSWPGSRDWQPEVQEEEVEVQIGDYKLVGFIDARDKQLIRDWKTARKPWDGNKKKAAWLQATVYGMATNIWDVEYLVLHYTDSNYNPNPGWQLVPYGVTLADIRRLKALVRAYGPLVQSSNIEDYPIRPNTTWLCSEKWCPFWSVCPGGDGPLEMEAVDVPW